MKISPLFAAPAFGLALLLTPARAEEPAPSALTPEMQALIVELLKSLAQSLPEALPVPEPEPATPATPTAPAAGGREAKPPLGTNSSLRTGGLVTGGLAGASLAPSSRGMPAAVTRLSNDEWRLLFPLRNERR